jgi:drug/metabolite transporter (DMT)-like permease
MSQIDPALWGFASMFAWGVSDMLARYATLRIGGPSVAMAIQGLGIAPPLLMALLLRDSPWSAILNLDFVVLAIMCSMLLSVGYVAFYRGLERGLVSIVSPLSAGYLVVATILTAIFFDEVVSTVGWMLIFVILVGIALTSSSGRSSASISGVWYGLTAMMVMGIAFALWKPMVEDAGPFLSVLSVRLLSSVFLGIYLIVRRSVRLSFPRSTGILLVSAAVLDSLGFISFNLGIELNPVSLIIPIAAAYPAVTMVMAWVLIKERVAGAQMVGIVTVLGGVIVFSAVT